MVSSMKNWKPLFIENSRVPIVLSYFAPIEISAITLGPIVLSRGEISEVTKRHETIHYQQYLETAFVGFIFLYLLTWLWGVITNKNPAESYKNIPFEREAYANHHDENYLKNRKRFAWIHYISS